LTNGVIVETGLRGGSGVLRWLRPVAFGLASLSTMITFIVVTGFIPLDLTPTRFAVLVGVNALFILMLLGTIGWDLAKLWGERRRQEAGARLHLRMAALFSLIAAVPAVVIAIVANIMLDRGLNPWFSGPLRELVVNSSTIARGYQQQLCQNVGREMRLMAQDIERAKRSGAFDANRKFFREFMTSRAIFLGFPFASIIQRDGTVVERADTRVGNDPVPPRDEDYVEAASQEPPCLITSSYVAALQKLESFENGYLYVSRPVVREAMRFGTIAAEAVAQYEVLDALRGNIRRGYLLIFALVTLTLLLAAMWTGLHVARRLAGPIRLLIDASDKVGAGNLYVQVPTRRTDADLAHLGNTFNAMTARLRVQQNNLIETSEALDRRRRFMETVLSGVSVGVIGTDADRHVTISNPVAERLLSAGTRTLVGASLDDRAPEIAELVIEAKAASARSLQRQINLIRGGREITLFVRVTADQAEAGERGFVITLDDISDLVTAQRTSAWADVARRIAHEIKNPLTPIQLSVERIQRKYGRHITEDRAIFDQCTQTIIRQVDDIRRMVDEFSSFARMPKPKLEREDLAETLRQVMFLMRVGNPDVQFHDNLPEGAVTGEFDRRLIGQAVQNILKNATEAAAEIADGQPVSVALTLTTTADRMAYIDIVDNGKGFPAESRQRLLEPYMTTREGGTGLGLAIVAKIFEDHGGGISLNDSPRPVPGRPGAWVRLWLPLGAAGAALPGDERPASVAAPQPEPGPELPASVSPHDTAMALK
jgi:two-component system nitrogen regulation sensor histidine kinase NtrY